MRWLVVGLISLGLAVSSSTAQEPVASSPAKKATYFLIDASGSMQDKFAKTEAAVAARLEEILSADQQATVSRTYFRAKDRNACWQPVPIADLVAASSSRPLPQKFSDDFTPLGAALEAAILQAGAGPADILVFSDERQTDQCGIDVCTVASSYLPRDGINVESIPIGSTASDRDRLGCLEGAQGKPRPDASTDIDAETVDSPAERKIDLTGSKWPLISFVEYWAWIVAFLCVAGSSAAIGYQHSSLSVYLENQTNEARSLRDLIRLGDAASESKIKTLGEETDKKISNELPTRGVTRWLNARTGFFLFGILILASLAVFPDGASVGQFQFGNAKASAWSVLNSDFSTAFAVTWIAIVFFAGSQDQRRREAQRSFAIATNEAARIAEAHRSESRKRAYEEYSNVYATIENYDFAVPAYSSDDFRDLEEATQFESDFARVSAEAIRIALGQRLDASEPEENLARRTDQLKSLATYRPRLFGSGLLEQPDLATFIARVRKLRPFPEDDAEWEGLSQDLKHGSIAPLGPRIAHLAGKVF